MVARSLWRRGAGILLITTGLLALAVPLAHSADTADFTLVNAERLKAGVPRLTGSAYLDGFALRHSQEMAAKGYIYHDPHTPGEVCCWSRYGENVGAGPDNVTVHEAFMNSPEHRDNILDPHFKLIGTGSVRKGTILYVTEIFVTPSTPLPAPKPQPRISPTPRRTYRASPRPTLSRSHRPSPSPSPTPTPSLSPTPSPSELVTLIPSIEASIPIPIRAHGPRHRVPLPYWVGLMLIGAGVLLVFGLRRRP